MCIGADFWMAAQRSVSLSRLITWTDLTWGLKRSKYASIPYNIIRAQPIRTAQINIVIFVGPFKLFILFAAFNKMLVRLAILYYAAIFSYLLVLDLNYVDFHRLRPAFSPYIFLQTEAHNPVHVVEFHVVRGLGAVVVGFATSKHHASGVFPLSASYSCLRN
jgi:hypothetical protein